MNLTNSPRYALSDIAGAIACDVTGDTDGRTVDTFLFDSRSLVNPEGVIFCALPTEAADGHSFVPDMYARGVRMFMLERMPDNPSRFDGAVFLQVSSVQHAIAALGKRRRDSLKARIVAVTGSAGKTVVKEMLYSTLASAGVSVARSPRSWNSQIGVPLSLLEMPDDADIIIVEAGIDRPGEMEILSDMIRPDIAVLTSVTDRHDAGFGSRDEKTDEKLRLLAAAPVRIYSDEDPAVNSRVRRMLGSDGATAVHCEGSFDERDATLTRAVLQSLGYSHDEATAMTAGLDAVSNRIDVHEGINDCVILYDGFTNDLRSLEASLDFMRRRATATRSNTLVMSDLFCASDSEYSALPALLDAFGITRVIAAGRRVAELSATFGPAVSVETVDSIDSLLEQYDINRFSSETILIAGGPSEGFRRMKAVLEAPRHDTIYEIDLDAIVHNFNCYRSLLHPTTGIVAMVKAQAYGTGALEVAKTMQAQGAAYLAVAVVDEGVELRRGGITMPIVVLNPVTTNYAALFRYRLEPSVFSLRELHTLVAEARRSGVESFKAHIKLDTGMHRVGFTENEIDGLLDALSSAPEMHVASVFSHLATADCPDEGEYTTCQLSTFARASQRIIDALPYPVMRHILNTAGIMTHPEYQYDMVRLGIGLYGVSPIDAPQCVDLRPVATLKSTIISIKTWPAGTTIGYARRGRLTRRSVIATVPIGYADGLDRHLSRGAASFIVRGVPCPTVGNICMDQCMIDITDVPDAAIGDEVEIFGNRQSVETIAAILDTIPYEPLCTVSPRVKRIYYRE